MVQYPPDRPWPVRIVKRPAPEWEDRAVSARLDSVPETAEVAELSEGCAFGLLVLLGAAAVVLLFRADLFDRDDTATPPSAARPSVSSTSSITVVSSASGTVALGPRQSFLDRGELNRALGSLTKGEDTRQALTVVVQERLLSVVFSPAGAQIRAPTPVRCPTTASQPWSRRPRPPSASPPR